MSELLEIASHMEPEKALAEVTEVLGHLLQSLDEDAREQLLMNVLDHFEGDKVASMAHL